MPQPPAAGDRPAFAGVTLAAASAAAIVALLRVAAWRAAA